MAIVPSFLFDFESEMMTITEDEFARLMASNFLWWKDLTKVRNTGKKREIISWLLSNAQLRDQGKGGNIHFTEMAATFQEYDVTNLGDALRMSLDQIEDNDGNGFDFAREWSTQMGQLFAYKPQEQISGLILNGTASTALAYDGVPYFSGTGNPHPYNQFKTGLGSFANLLTGASSGSYPGALPIDESVTLEQAVINVQKVIAYAASIKMPNGTTPRALVARRLCVPPRLMARAQLITKARTIAMAAGSSGGGSTDFEAVITNWGFMEPIEIQELAGATYANGANPDTTWFMAFDVVTSSQLGAFVYVEREPYRITYYTGQGGGTGTDAVLDRARNLEWHAQGRNAHGYGHPYAMMQVQAT